VRGGHTIRVPEPVYQRRARFAVASREGPRVHHGAGRRLGCASLSGARLARCMRQQAATDAASRRGAPGAWGARARRDAEVLSLFAAIISKLREAMGAEVPRIFEAVFECTLQMITKNFEARPRPCAPSNGDKPNSSASFDNPGFYSSVGNPAAWCLCVISCCSLCYALCCRHTDSAK
jgi:hypothetical protein